MHNCIWVDSTVCKCGWIREKYSVFKVFSDSKFFALLMIKLDVAGLLHLLHMCVQC